MLGGSRETASLEQLNTIPTVGQSTFAAFAKPTEQVNQLYDYVYPGLSSKEERIQGMERLESINHILSNPNFGIGQEGLNMVSNIAGGLIPTAPFVATGALSGAAVAGVIGFGAREIALDLGTEGALTAYLGTQVPLRTLATGTASHLLPNFSIGGVATGIAETYGGYKGMIIPEHFAEHYNAIENSLDTAHAIEDWGSDNYGFLLSAIPLVGGYIGVKGIKGVISIRKAGIAKKELDSELSRLLKDHESVLKENEIKEGEHQAKVAKVSELQDHLQQAEDMGMISPEMHEWYLDYLERPADQTKIHEGAMKALKSLQIPYDRVTGRVWNELISPDAVRNLKGAWFDEAITNLSEEENQLLSSYIVHNQLDGYLGHLKEHPNLLMAMDGMTQILSEKIAAQSLALKNLDEVISSKIDKSLGKRELFSQQNIYDHLKKIGVYSKQHIPYEVPTAIINRLAIERKIKKILSRETLKDEEMYQNGIHHELKEELKNTKLLTPGEELSSLKKNLYPKGNLIKNYKNNNDYFRLEDLSQVWAPAKVLLDRINMEAMNAKQKGLNEILKKFVGMVDTHAENLADPVSVKRYLHSRIEKAVPTVREFEGMGINIESNESRLTREKEIVRDEIALDDSVKESINASEFHEGKETYQAVESKLKQLSENELALKELINCALGG